MYAFSFYSFMQMSSKLYMCLGHGLKICIFFWIQSSDYFLLLCSVFTGQSEYILGILCMHLLLQFYADSFETLQRLSLWSKYVNIVWI